MGATKRELVNAGHKLVTRDHRCGACGEQRCITERKLGEPLPWMTSHYVCELCHEIYDTKRHIPYVETRTGYDEVMGCSAPA